MMNEPQGHVQSPSILILTRIVLTIQLRALKTPWFQMNSSKILLEITEQSVPFLCLVTHLSFSVYLPSQCTL